MSPPDDVNETNQSKKKARERRQLHFLAQAMPELPWTTMEQGESPDCLLTRPDGSKLGIELTDYRLHPDEGTAPASQTDSLRERAVSRACDLYARRGGVALYLAAMFANDAPPSKKSVDEIVVGIVDALLKTSVPKRFEDGSVDVEPELLPAGVHAVQVSKAIPDDDPVWYAGDFTWEATIEPKHVSAIIESKAPKLALYRENCDEIWLVIVHNPLTPATHARLSERAEQTTYETGFDRVLWFLANEMHTKDLSIEWETATD